VTRPKRGFATVRRENSGRYSVRYTPPGGKRKSAGKTFQNKADAEACAAELYRGTDLPGILAAPIHDGESFDPAGFFVYLLWGDDPQTPIYVGESGNVFARIGAHMREKSDAIRRVQLFRCETVDVMHDTEARLIKHFAPPLNSAPPPRRFDVGDPLTPERGREIAALLSKIAENCAGL
jgi:hypothetical protein